MPYQLKFSGQPHFGRFTPEFFRPFGPSVLFWGAGAGFAVTLFLSSVPLFKKDVLQKLPVINDYFIDKTPDSDKPF